jgi:hypothetical protein
MKKINKITTPSMLQKKQIILLLFVILCANLRAQEDIDVHYTLLDSPLLDIVWCGNNQGDDYNVLILTNKGTVYRSTDRGNTWETLSQVF